jgi:hypothetical protein
MIPWQGIVAIVAAILAAVCIGNSVLGGWAELARFYRQCGTFTGDRRRFESLRLGWVHYNHCAVLGISDEGLFLSLIPVFRLWHPPLLIPWTELTLDWKKTFVFESVYLEVRARQAPDCAICLYSGPFGRTLAQVAETKRSGSIDRIASTTDPNLTTPEKPTDLPRHLVVWPGKVLSALTREDIYGDMH